MVLAQALRGQRGVPRQPAINDGRRVERGKKRGSATGPHVVASLEVLTGRAFEFSERLVAIANDCADYVPDSGILTGRCIGKRLAFRVPDLDSNQEPSG